MTMAGPDKGYGWVIVFCCSYMHFALFGLFRSWGVVYSAVLQEYGVSRQEASWPFSLCSSVFMLIGPSVSIMTHYISNRAASLLGCAIATIGVVGCYFATSVLWITISYGMIHGFGFGVICILIPVFLNQYFVKHRATALGIAFSGGSIGSFVIPIAMERLLEDYNLRGTFLILGGLIMNTLIAASLLRPPPWLKKSKTTKLLEDLEVKDSGVSSSSGDIPDEIKDNFSDPIKSEHLHSEFVGNTREIDKNDSSSIVDVSQLDPPISEDTSERLDTIISSNDSVLFGGSVSKICADSSNTYERDEIGDKTDCEAQLPLVTKRNKNKSRIFNCAAYLSIMEILKNPMFHLITLSMFIYFLALQCFFVVIVDYTKDKGIPEEDGVYLIPIFSITDLVARSGLGWITDRNYVKRKHMIIFDFFVIGILYHLYPLIDGLTGLLVIVAFHGIVSGSCISLFFLLQADYLGIKRLTLVIGLASFINGTLSLFRPTMIGLFRDHMGSYDWLFHSLGIMSIVFALIWLAESWITTTKKNLNPSSKEET